MHKLNALHFAKHLIRNASDNKSNSGNVVVIGGATSMTGSIVLASLGALYTGSGWVKLIPLDPRFPHIIQSFPEFMIYKTSHSHPQDILKSIQPDVIVIGPGLGQTETSKSWLLAAIEYYSPLIIDADGLNLLALYPEFTNLISDRFWTTIMTPHTCEASRLLNTTIEDVQKDRTGAIMQLIELYNSIVILKGHKTLIGMKAETVLTCLDGNSGMACAGMGDVLTGVIASFVAQGLHHHLSPWQASCLAIEVHALAGDSLARQGIGPIGMTPSELAKEMRHILNNVI